MPAYYGYMSALWSRGVDDRDHRTKKRKERDIRKAKLKNKRKK